jgi:hypothetical protein
MAGEGWGSAMMPAVSRHLLAYLIRFLQGWQQFTLIDPRRDCAPAMHPLDAAVQAYLRSAEPHPLFDQPVVIWWSDPDHALLIPCRLQDDGSHLCEDGKAFRLVRANPPAQCAEQLDSL